MYFSTHSIVSAIERLGKVHPFLGITFLACKEKQLPIGETVICSLDVYTRKFMERVHKICPTSSHFYQPYRSNARSNVWLAKNYPASGLQAINTGKFKDVWLHEEKERTWGWRRDYVEIISELLQSKSYKRAFVIDLAIWVFKDKKWEGGTNPDVIIEHFISHFNISVQEKEELFSADVDHIEPSELFQEKKVSWIELGQHLISPPDAVPSRGATLSFLELSNVGPASHLCMEPASRLNIILGDNGLGKTFLMDCAWWALTGIWAEQPACPNSLKQSKATIAYELACKKTLPIKTSVSYDTRQGVWPRNKKNVIPGLIVYARVDGSYAVWDPITQYDSKGIHKKQVFSRDEVWDGMNGNIEGLIRDWVKWQNMTDKSLFNMFIRVLDKLSPPDLGNLEPGEPDRILDDPRDIPHIIFPYGNIPIVYASAGVKRIITLAYLIVWAWHEHNVNAKLRGIRPDNRLVIFIDEIEAHLHPKWQRKILPALLDVQEILSGGLETQFVVSAHSPLVLASAETVFNYETDKLFHLDLNTETREAELSEVEFMKYGLVNSWLTSPIFKLKHARSHEAEEAIEKAKKLQLDDKPCTDSVRSTHSDLCKYLAETDLFWPRWIFFAEQHGVEI